VPVEAVILGDVGKAALKEEGATGKREDGGSGGEKEV
jgi:hypothetical protein